MKKGGGGRGAGFYPGACGKVDDCGRSTEFCFGGIPLQAQAKALGSVVKFYPPSSRRHLSNFKTNMSSPQDPSQLVSPSGLSGLLLGFWDTLKRFGNFALGDLPSSKVGAGTNSRVRQKTYHHHHHNPSRKQATSAQPIPKQRTYGNFPPRTNRAPRLQHPVDHRRLRRVLHAESAQLRHLKCQADRARRPNRFTLAQPRPQLTFNEWYSRNLAAARQTLERAELEAPQRAEREARRNELAERLWNQEEEARQNKQTLRREAAERREKVRRAIEMRTLRAEFSKKFKVCYEKKMKQNRSKALREERARRSKERRDMLREESMERRRQEQEATKAQEEALRQAELERTRQEQVRLEELLLERERRERNEHLRKMKDLKRVAKMARERKEEEARKQEELLRQAAEKEREEAARIQEEEASRQREEAARIQEEEEMLLQREEEQRREIMQNNILAEIDRQSALYEAKWAELKSGREIPILRSFDFPWPIFSFNEEYAAQSPEIRVREFLMHPRRLALLGKTPREMLKMEILRWHPDKFSTVVLPKVDENEHDQIQLNAVEVTKLLTQMMEEE
jgi:hypothetical protein